MRTVRLLSIEFVLTIIGIIMLGKLPYLLFDMDGLIFIQKAIDTGKLRNALFLSYEIDVDFKQYAHAIIDTGKQLLHASDLMYYNSGRLYPIFPELWDYYLYSVKILAASFGFAILITVILTYLIMLFSNSKIRKWLSSVIDVFQMFPDVFLVLLFQFIVVYIYKKTNVLLFNIMSFNGDNAYWLPIICLTILPTVFLTKSLLQIYEEQLQERYVDTAMAKGVRRSGILIIHIFRNSVVSLFHHSKTLFWFTLSNLLMLEVLFNINGLTSFMWEYGTISPHVFIIGMLMLFFPFFIVFVLGGLFVSKYTTTKSGVFG